MDVAAEAEARAAVPGLREFAYQIKRISLSARWV